MAAKKILTTHICAVILALILNTNRPVGSIHCARSAALGFWGLLDGQRQWTVEPAFISKSEFLALHILMFKNPMGLFQNQKITTGCTRR
jgi:hypothetical protein